MNDFNIFLTVAGVIFTLHGAFSLFYLPYREWINKIAPKDEIKIMNRKSEDLYDFFLRVRSLAFGLLLLAVVFYQIYT